MTNNEWAGHFRICVGREPTQRRASTTWYKNSCRKSKKMVTRHHSLPHGSSFLVLSPHNSSPLSWVLGPLGNSLCYMEFNSQEATKVRMTIKIDQTKNKTKSSEIAHFLLWPRNPQFNRSLIRLLNWKFHITITAMVLRSNKNISDLEKLDSKE